MYAPSSSEGAYIFLMKQVPVVRKHRNNLNELLLFVVSVTPFFSFFFLTKPSFHVSLHQFNNLFISKDFNKNNLNVTIIILTLKIVLGVP
jgi:hypothetical protein